MLRLKRHTPLTSFSLRLLAPCGLLRRRHLTLHQLALGRRPIHRSGASREHVASGRGSSGARVAAAAATTAVVITPSTTTTAVECELLRHQRGSFRGVREAKDVVRANGEAVTMSEASRGAAEYQRLAVDAHSRADAGGGYHHGSVGGGAARDRCVPRRHRQTPQHDIVRHRQTPQHDIVRQSITHHPAAAQAAAHSIPITAVTRGGGGSRLRTRGRPHAGRVARLQGVHHPADHRRVLAQVHQVRPRRNAHRRRRRPCSR
mmetsp:Transcript_31231/g.78193  ORF Transcript_31231/g.78193 Transcript_31231/m.78193 type:complete len:261 (-) Transcript_31231:496-1278(-)